MSRSDAELVLQVLDGDQAAFGELYDRYARLIRVICHGSTRDLAAAQDLGQEVFLRAYAKLDKLKEPEKFAGWLVTIARNVCREHRRSKGRDKHVLVGSEILEQTPQKEVVRDSRLDQLQEAMAQLDERERLALHIYYLQGEDIEKAKEVLGVSRSAFYRLLDKGKKKVERYIKRREQS